MPDGRVALITGANRGLGLGVAEDLAGRGMTVALCARDAAKGETAARGLRDTGLRVESFVLDTAEAESVKAGVAAVLRRFGRVDVLVNNAAIYLDKKKVSAELADPAMVAQTFDVNVLGPLRVIQAVLPAMRRTGYGRIVNVASEMAQLSAMGPGAAGYRISKTALVALTRTLARDVGEGNIKVNAVDPGWVKTDMGGPEAPRALAEGVASIVYGALLADDGPTGGFFLDGKQVEW
jgi:NAD(P)-dependent dehydrogenase (short-subunit alcohol dehydrogenase family)